jgi:hypothetical protein
MIARGLLFCLRALLIVVAMSLLTTGILHGTQRQWLQAVGDTFFGGAGLWFAVVRWTPERRLQ